MWKRVFMKYILITIVFSLNCFAVDNIGQRLSQIFSSIVRSVSMKVNVQTKDIEIKKVYSANVLQLNHPDDFKSQTVVMEVWDHKTNRQILLISPQGSSDFYEIKDLHYIRSNSTSDLQHIFAGIYVEENGVVKKHHLEIFKEYDSLSMHFHLDGLKEKSQISLNRLMPTIENTLKEFLASKISSISLSPVKIEAGYKINGQYYFKAEGKTLESNLLILNSEGKLIKSKMVEHQTPHFTSIFYEKGIALFSVSESKSDNSTYSYEKLSVDNLSKLLQFKTFDFKTLIETKVVEKSFRPEYYMRLDSGRTLFITEIELLNVTRDSIMLTMIRDNVLEAKVMIKTLVKDKVLEMTYDGQMEYLRNGIFLSIYGKDRRDVLKINISDSFKPSIVTNNWQIKEFGRVFDANFKIVAEQFEKLSKILGPKILSCKKMIGG